MNRFLLGLALLFIVPMASALELIYIHSDGCHYCQKFKAEVGEVGYRANDISTVAPMVIIDVEQDYPDWYIIARGADDDNDVDAIKPILYTPTFILIDDDDNEVGRFIGYRDPEWFFRKVNTLVTEYEEAQ